MNKIMILKLMYLGVFVLIIGLMIPLALGKIKRNHIYGFRLTNSMKNDELWMVINRRCAVFSLKLIVIPFIVFASLAFINHSIIIYLFPTVILMYVAIMTFKSYSIDKSYAGDPQVSSTAKNLAQQVVAPEAASPPR